MGTEQISLSSGVSSGLQDYATYIQPVSAPRSIGCSQPEAGVFTWEWPDTFLARVAAMALLETLNADLLSHASATLTLERWCDAHGFALESTVTAHVFRDRNLPVTPENRQRLNIGAEEPVRYRHVQLFCGEKMLSEADNWYVPSRLTSEMNRQLNETNTPFGCVVKALGLQRHTLVAKLLWRPLPKGWELMPVQEDRAGSLWIPERILEHRAVLYTKAREPFSVLRESYTRNIFAFPLVTAKWQQQDDPEKTRQFQMACGY
jgi:hypothetical protein